MLLTLIMLPAANNSFALAPMLQFKSFLYSGASAKPSTL
jgi:hypothetical protein